MDLNRIIGAIKQNFCTVLSAIFSVVMFAFPIQTTDSIHGAITGFDVMNLSPDFVFWGRAYVPYYKAFSCVLFAFAVVAVVFAGARALLTLFNPESPFVKNSGKTVLRIGITLAVTYAIIGIVLVACCHQSWKPTTSAYWPLVIQIFIGILAKITRSVA